MFSFKRLKSLLSFGWKLLVSSLMDTIYGNLRNLIIGKVYSSSDLAFYDQGDKFPKAIVININSSIDSVLLPTMSSVQEDSSQVRHMTRRAIKTSTYIMAPLMMGLAFCASPIVRLLLTDKWLSCVPFLQIFCITYMLWPVHTSNLNALKAMGRSDLYLKLEVIKKILGLILLFITMKISVKAMAYSLLVSGILGQIINSWPNRKLLNYGYLQQLKDILPAIILSVFMGALVSLIELIGLTPLLTLIIQVPVGVVVYIVGSKIFKLESYYFLLNIIKSFANKTK